NFSFFVAAIFPPDFGDRAYRDSILRDKALRTASARRMIARNKGGRGGHHGSSEGFCATGAGLDRKPASGGAAGRRSLSRQGGGGADRRRARRRRRYLCPRAGALLWTFP